MNMQIVGMQELLNYLSDMGERVPRQSLAKGVRKGTNQIMKDAKGDVPVLSGTLRNGIRTVTEKGNRNKLKVVMDVYFDPAMNSVFQKPVKENPGKYGGKPNGSGMYYYPASMEFGFKTSKGWETGHYFMKYARDKNDTAFLNTIEQALNDEIDRLG